MPEEPGAVVRRARADELGAMLALYQHLHATDAPPASSDLLKHQWRAIVEDPRLHCLVAEIDGRLVSSCTLVLVPNLTRGARSYGLIENVVTHAAFQRRGLGRRVLDAALKIAWEHDCYKVMLMTGRKDEAILRFYEAAGFERGVKTGMVAYPDE